MLCLKDGISLPIIDINPIYNQFNGLNIVYIGISINSLRTRDYKQHFEGNNAGRSTLRKSIGSMFGYQKIPRDINNSTNGKTKFNDKDEVELSIWMSKSLVLFFNDEVRNYDLNQLEYDLIDYYKPVLNIQKNYDVNNKAFRQELKRLRRQIMGCFNTLFILLLGGMYFFWPELMQVEGFWFTMIAVWVVFFISFALFGDIADEIAGVNKYKDN